MKSFEVLCFFVLENSDVDVLHSMRVLRFSSSDVFSAVFLARDYLLSCAEDLEFLGRLDKLEVVEV